MASSFLKDAHPELVGRWIAVLDAYCTAHPGSTLRVTCTYRSPEEQQVLYGQGRTAPGTIVTERDGVAHRSLHNMLPARALDFAVLVAGKVVWDASQYEPVGALAQAHGLVWGGAWPHFKDFPHVELPKEIV